jgi:hypothetical protein
MLCGAVDWLLKNEYWIIGAGENELHWQIKIHKSKTKRSDRSYRYSYVLAIPHQHPNEFLNPYGFRF